LNRHLFPNRNFHKPWYRQMGIAYRPTMCS
jgi:hypothetical protein